MSEKSQWGSKLGFILASAGSAIGLGAVWKFPYMTAANGGGGFLLVFLVSTILIGFPLLLAEFALGRSAGVSAIKTFGKLGKNSKYNFIGWIGAFALFILLSFYSVIGGWILVYLGIEFGKLFQIGGTGGLCSVIYFNHFKSSHCPRSSSSLYPIEYLHCITWGSKRD